MLSKQVLPHRFGQGRVVFGFKLSSAVAQQSPHLAVSSLPEAQDPYSSRGLSRLSPYGCCPGGAWPAGLVAGFCVSPPPVHTGCCPPGWLPPAFVQFAGEIAPNAAPPKAIINAITNAVINNNIRFLIASGLLSLVWLLPLSLGTRVSTIPPKS